ncbi:hypothetical protein Q3G72_010167 [Acer saccharum]|nr:hypothetical protein Q3G72_010167 [Acer saccharum]
MVVLVIKNGPLMLKMRKRKKGISLLVHKDFTLDSTRFLLTKLESEVSESKQENVRDIIKNQPLDNQLIEIKVELQSSMQKAAQDPLEKKRKRAPKDTDDVVAKGKTRPQQVKRAKRHGTGFGGDFGKDHPEIGKSEVSESKQENVVDIIKNQQLDNQLIKIKVELRKNNEEIIKKLQETVQKSLEKVQTEFLKSSVVHLQNAVEINRTETAQKSNTAHQNEKTKNKPDEVAKGNTKNRPQIVTDCHLGDRQT